MKFAVGAFVAAVIVVVVVVESVTGGSNKAAYNLEVSSTPSDLNAVVVNNSAQPQDQDSAQAADAEASAADATAMPTRPDGSLPVRLGWTSAARIRWRHLTSAGTRWSLKQLRHHQMALLIEIGDDQVATAFVASQFASLDIQTMDARVEHVKAEVIKTSTTSASYVYSRDGAVTAVH